MVPKCSCGADLSQPASVQYLSGDKWDSHIEDIDGVLTIVQDDDYECDSFATCSACGEPVGYDEQAVY